MKIIEECKEILTFVDLPNGEYTSWLAKDAWKVIERIESLSDTHAANALLYKVARAANYKAYARRYVSFKDIDFALARAKEILQSAETIPDDFVEEKRLGNLSYEQETKALLLQTRDIESGTRRILAGTSGGKEYIKDLKEYIHYHS